ncbi:MAG: polysaccharide deacetylase family protein [Leptolyngbyaceae cyanobacterium bins.302]|nr:polysaccharide deacetylase family protein [Leptolyngbyaceae cyanobacterium bins.302]
MVSSLQFAPIYPVVHRVLKPIFPNCLWGGNNQHPSVALTFDDGPHPRHTPQLLEVLDRYGVQATFFWLGACVEQAPEVARAVYDRGHWLGLHGYDHRSFPTLSDSELKASLQRTQKAISEVCQLAPSNILDVRPPNGLFTPKTLNLLTQWNYRPVMWSVVPEDWVVPGVAVVVSRILQQVKNGSIIVLHDGNCGGEDVAQVANYLIPLLLQQGYAIVSIDQLWQQLPTVR